MKTKITLAIILVFFITSCSKKKSEANPDITLELYFKADTSELIDSSITIKKLFLVNTKNEIFKLIDEDTSTKIKIGYAKSPASIIRANLPRDNYNSLEVVFDLDNTSLNVITSIDKLNTKSLLWQENDRYQFKQSIDLKSIKSKNSAFLMTMLIADKLTALTEENSTAQTISPSFTLAATDDETVFPALMGAAFSTINAPEATDEEQSSDVLEQNVKVKKETETFTLTSREDGVLTGLVDSTEKILYDPSTTLPENVFLDYKYLYPTQSFDYKNETLYVKPYRLVAQLQSLDKTLNQAKVKPFTLGGFSLTDIAIDESLSTLLNTVQLTKTTFESLTNLLSEDAAKELTGTANNTSDSNNDQLTTMPIVHISGFPNPADKSFSILSITPVEVQSLTADIDLNGVKDLKFDIGKREELFILDLTSDNSENIPASVKMTHENILVSLSFNGLILSNRTTMNIVDTTKSTSQYTTVVSFFNQLRQELESGNTVKHIQLTGQIQEDLFITDEINLLLTDSSEGVTQTISPAGDKLEEMAQGKADTANDNSSGLTPLQIGLITGGSILAAAAVALAGTAIHLSLKKRKISSSKYLATTINSDDGQVSDNIADSNSNSDNETNSGITNTTTDTTSTSTVADKVTNSGNDTENNPSIDNDNLPPPPADLLTTDDSSSQSTIDNDNLPPPPADFLTTDDSSSQSTQVLANADVDKTNSIPLPPPPPPIKKTTDIVTPEAVQTITVERQATNTLQTLNEGRDALLSAIRGASHSNLNHVESSKEEKRPPSVVEKMMIKAYDSPAFKNMTKILNSNDSSSDNSSSDDSEWDDSFNEDTNNKLIDSLAESERNPIKPTADPIKIDDIQISVDPSKVTTGDSNVPYDPGKVPQTLGNESSRSPSSTTHNKSVRK